MKKNTKKTPHGKTLFLFGLLFFLLGCIFILNAFTSITGLSIIENTSPPASGFLGVISMTLGLTFVSLSQGKRGQAAMEFLMTYGWAILAAIVVIGAIVYFIPLNQTFLAPDYAIIGPPLTIKSWTIQAGDVNGPSAIFIEIQNGGAGAISITDFTVTGYAKGTKISGGAALDTDPALLIVCENYYIYAGNPKLVEPGKTEILAVECSSTFPMVGDPFKGDLEITYTKSSSNIENSAIGEIRGIAIEGDLDPWSFWV